MLDSKAGCSGEEAASEGTAALGFLVLFLAGAAVAAAVAAFSAEGVAAAAGATCSAGVSAFFSTGFEVFEEAAASLRGRPRFLAAGFGSEGFTDSKRASSSRIANPRFGLSSFLKFLMFRLSANALS